MRLSLFGGHSGAVVQVLTKTLAITTPQLHQRASAQLAGVTGSPVVERSILWPQGNMSPCDRHVFELRYQASQVWDRL